MSDNISSSTGTDWAKVASRSLRSKNPPPLHKEDRDVNRTLFKPLTIFEDKEISAYLRNQQVLSIVKTALQPESVIFSFPADSFSHCLDAYKLVLEKLAPVISGGFNPISLRASLNSRGLVFSTSLW
jgi:hypothetical protein